MISELASKQIRFLVRTWARNEFFYHKSSSPISLCTNAHETFLMIKKYHKLFKEVWRHQISKLLIIISKLLDSSQFSSS